MADNIHRADRVRRRPAMNFKNNHEAFVENKKLRRRLINRPSQYLMIENMRRMQQQSIDKEQKFKSMRKMAIFNDKVKLGTLTIGPTINPRPKNVSSVAKVVPTEFGNSFAIIANDDVRKAAFPKASIILITKARVMNIV